MSNASCFGSSKLVQLVFIWVLTEFHPLNFGPVLQVTNTTLKAIAQCITFGSLWFIHLTIITMLSILCMMLGYRCEETDQTDFKVLTQKYTDTCLRIASQTRLKKIYYRLIHYTTPGGLRHYHAQCCILSQQGLPLNKLKKKKKE